MDPISASVMFTGISSAFQFADIAFRIAEVGSENEVFVRTIHVVRDDLNEVERLLSVKSIETKLARIPEKLPWIRGTITNTKTALNHIGKAVERARAEQQATGSIRFETRVRWILNDHEKILNRTNELSTCHRQLSSVLSYLLRLEDVTFSMESLAVQDDTYFDDIISRHRRSVLKPSEHGMLSQSLLSPVKPTDNAKPGHNIHIGMEGHTSTSQGPRHAVPSDVSFSSQGRMRTSSLSVSCQTTSPPYTPLPSYASVMQLNSTIPNYSFGHDPQTSLGFLDQERCEPPSQLDTTSACSNLVPQLPSSETKEMKDWAYRYPQSEVSLPELEGDVVCLTATNSQGPVNPFEFLSSPQPPVITLNPEIGDTNSLSGLQEGLHFPAELPTNDARLALGYLSTGERDLVYNTKRNTATSGYIEPSDARAIPRSIVHSASRSLSTNAASDCTVPRYELSSTSFALAIEGPELGERKFPEAPKHSVSATDFSSWSNAPSIPHCLPLRVPNHSSDTLTPSIPLPKTNAQYDSLQHCFPHQAKQLLSRSRSAVDLNMQSQNPKPESSASVTRMRSQRQVMALLESIGT